MLQGCATVFVAFSTVRVFVALCGCVYDLGCETITGFPALKRARRGEVLLFSHTSANTALWFLLPLLLVASALCLWPLFGLLCDAICVYAVKVTSNSPIDSIMTSLVDTQFWHSLTLSSACRNALVLGSMADAHSTTYHTVRLCVVIGT